MKDLHWILVFGSILITPFLPALIKARCPSCTKRKIQSLENLRVPSQNESSGFTYIAFYQCENCGELFKKVKAGDFESSNQEEHEKLTESALV